MEKIYRHYQDPDGRAAISGALAQQMFKESLGKLGFKVSKTELYDDKYNHKDYYMEISGIKLSTDVKYPKKISRRDLYPSKEWTWVEFTGTTGYPGWLYGNEQTIAFLMPDMKKFMIVNREELKNLCERICSKEKVLRREDAKYKIYSRSAFGAKDEISLIRYDDIIKNCFHIMIPVV